MSEERRLVLITWEAIDQIVDDEWDDLSPSMQSAVHSLREYTRGMGNTLKDYSERLASLTRERDEARALVAEANNSLYGSHAYFHSTNGGEFDKYHLAKPIEKLKASARAWARVEAAAERVTHYAYGRTPDEQVGEVARRIIRERREFESNGLSSVRDEGDAPNG